MKKYLILLVVLLSCDEPYVHAPGTVRQPIEYSDPAGVKIKFFVTLDIGTKLDPQHLSMAKLRLQVKDCDGQLIWNEGWFTSANTHDGTWVSGNVSYSQGDSLHFVITDNDYYWRRPVDRATFKFRFLIEQDGFPKVEHRNIGYDGFVYAIQIPEAPSSAKMLTGG